MKIYLDNCCFNRPYDDQELETIAMEAQAKIQIQKMIKNKEIFMTWSFILDYENSANPSKVKRQEIQNWEKIASSVIAPNNDIFTLSEQYKELGLKQKDSLHIACAIYEGCDVFITVDKGILKKAVLFDKLKILNPIEFLYFIEENNAI